MSKLGIAYSMKQRNKKKMADGGSVDSSTQPSKDDAPYSQQGASQIQSGATKPGYQTKTGGGWANVKSQLGFAEGGEVKPDMSEDEEMKDRKIDMSADIHGEKRMMDTHMDSEPAELHESDLNQGKGSKAHQPSDPLSSVVEAILKDRRMAQGGMVDENEGGNHNESVFEPKDAFNDHGQDGNLKENYASDVTNEDLDDSIVGQILADRKKKKKA